MTRRITAGCLRGTKHERSFVSITRILPELRAFFIFLKDPNNWTPYLTTGENEASAIETEAQILLEQIRKAEQDVLTADDRLMDGTFDTERHAHQINRLKARIVQLQSDLTTLDDRRQVIDYVAQRESRLQEIAEHGLEYLDMDDERAANAKLRRLAKIWIKAGNVHYIEVL